MIKLENGCFISDLKVHPKNWLNAKASTKKDWYIHYRFYDLSAGDKYKYGKLIILKGMNQFKTVVDRQNETRTILEQESNKLKGGSYRLINGKIINGSINNFLLQPTSYFLIALENAEKRISCSASAKRDLRSILGIVKKAAIQLNYDLMPINSVTRKHIKQILLYIDFDMGESAHRYNKVRSYLMIIYKELIELEVVDANPLKDISKKKIIHRLKKLPSADNRKAISEYLKLNHYRFWLFTQIFFHSGARLTELLQVKEKNVDLKRQVFVILIKKGNTYREVERPIKNIALSFWKEVVVHANAEDFIFSKGLIPGECSIQSYQITKRWNRHIKKKLGIEYDFYSLKHLNLDQTANILGINDAAAMASHSSTAVTIKHYAVNELHRQFERLKLVKNEF